MDTDEEQIIYSLFVDYTNVFREKLNEIDKEISVYDEGIKEQDKKKEKLKQDKDNKENKINNNEDYENHMLLIRKKREELNNKKEKIEFALEDVNNLIRYLYFDILTDLYERFTYANYSLCFKFTDTYSAHIFKEHLAKDFPYSYKGYKEDQGYDEKEGAYYYVKYNLLKEGKSILDDADDETEKISENLTLKQENRPNIKNMIMEYYANDKLSKIEYEK